MSCVSEVICIIEGLHHRPRRRGVGAPTLRGAINRTSLPSSQGSALFIFTPHVRRLHSLNCHF